MTQHCPRLSPTQPQVACKPSAINLSSNRKRIGWMWMAARRKRWWLVRLLKSKEPPQLLSLCGAMIDRVTAFKLLGVYVSCDLKWSEHVNAIVSKAASCLWFLKQLKRAGASSGSKSSRLIIVKNFSSWVYSESVGCWRFSTGVLNCLGFEAQNQDSKCKTKTVKILPRDALRLPITATRITQGHSLYQVWTL